MRTFLLFQFLFINLTVNSQNTNSNLVVGNNFYKKHEFAKAIEFYKKELVVNVNNLMVIYNLGLANYKAGNLTDAIKSFEKVITITTNKQLLVVAYYNLGVVYVKNNQFVEAQNAYQHSLLLNSKNKSCKENLQLLLNNLKNKKNTPSSDSESKVASEKKNNKELNPKVEIKNSTTGEELLINLQKQENLLKGKLQKAKKNKDTNKQSIIDW